MEVAAVATPFTHGTVRRIAGSTWTISRTLQDAVAFHLLHSETRTPLPITRIQLDTTSGAWTAIVSDCTVLWASAYIPNPLTSMGELDALLFLVTCTDECHGVQLPPGILTSLAVRYGGVTTELAPLAGTWLRSFDCHGTVGLFARVSVRFPVLPVFLFPRPVA